MGDIYKFLTLGEGRIIGQKAYKGDILCKKIINRYVVHRKDQKCEDAAKELRKILKEYAAILRIVNKKWPNNIPISLRSYAPIMQPQNYTEPPG